ncbi:hypothetical protein VP01_8083g1 [Puccinia sorghi]|uniref:Uncharacterized protein n=1 Tax=Puccinia sorghi TaxID=27349 RepID=A0A0L6UB50_9BASI|nr:hypothetical protein VP01_8083g1 [Puccinia sorghi]
MDEINPTILKTTMKAIPMLSEENIFELALFQIRGMKDHMINGKPLKQRRHYRTLESNIKAFYLFQTLKSNEGIQSIHQYYLQHEQHCKRNLLKCLKLTCNMLQPSCHPNSTCVYTLGSPRNSYE